jgi:elongation factor Ts
MSIDAEQVKELRDRTSAGILDCKEALKETDGDMEEAVEYLEKKGITAAKQKSGRVAAEGLVDDWANADRNEAALVEVNSETDFVARNDEFQEFVATVAERVGESGVESVDAAQDLEIDGTSLSDAVNERIATLGENIRIRRIDRMANDGGTIGTYIHAGSQIGVLVSVEVDGDPEDDEVQSFARDVAMHIAAMDPPFLSPNAIPEEAMESQEEVFAAQMEEQGKPEHIIPQIVEGKIDKWKTEHSLTEQPFVKDSDRTVGELQESLENVEVVDFVRYEVGEGVEEDEENFAEEVHEQLED